MTRLRLLILQILSDCTRMSVALPLTVHCCSKCCGAIRGADGEMAKDDDDEKPKEKANFEVSGLLAKEVNTFNGVEVIYTQPQEARNPKERWRLYPFKGEQAFDPLYIHRQSAYLIGKEKKVGSLHRLSLLWCSVRCLQQRCVRHGV